MSKSFYIHKKRHLDSHRSTVTTQTQNKTRQNYYTLLDLSIFAYTQEALSGDLHNK